MKFISHNDSQKNSLTTIIISFGIAYALFANAAYANDYQVEIIVFENNNASLASENNEYVPPKRMRSGSKAWFLKPSLLVEEAKKISDSEHYTFRYHYAYGVESLPYQQSANYTIIERDLKGYVKIYADQLLFANIDIDFNGFRMNQKRRLKLNERHFFDHPKFGLLVQVSRLEASPQKQSNTEPATLESSR